VLFVIVFICSVQSGCFLALEFVLSLDCFPVVCCKDVIVLVCCLLKLGKNIHISLKLPSNC
jgi:hypothetical protein